jgi:hypothetical protein
MPAKNAIILHGGPNREEYYDPELLKEVLA